MLTELDEPTTNDGSFGIKTIDNHFALKLNQRVYSVSSLMPLPYGRANYYSFPRARGRVSERVSAAERVSEASSGGQRASKAKKRAVSYAIDAIVSKLT